MKKIMKSEMFSWITALTIALIMAFGVRAYIFEPFIVEGASMEPTLNNNEKLLVNKVATYTGSVKSQDIIIIDGDEDINYVKRVIGLPGDKVEMTNDKLLINGEAVDEPYIEEEREKAHAVNMNFTGDFGPITVPAHKYFVLGDNRLNSMDSRNGLGLIDKDQIIGVSEYVVMPIKEARKTE